MTKLDAEACNALTAQLQTWRQGDCFVGEFWFITRIDPDGVLTDDALPAAADAGDNSETEELGFMVVTQTCDLVRDCSKRPFVEISPLVKIDSDSDFANIKRGRVLRYVFIPGLENQRLVADLDRTMTAEKTILCDLTPTQGFTTDTDFRRLSLALARKRSRFAFPDDFVEFVRPLTSRLRSKHDKNSAEGAALKALREIRVRAQDWDAQQVELMFWFIREDDGMDPTSFLESWLNLIPDGGRFSNVDGVVTTLDDMTGRDYVESDSLDLENLSQSEG